MPSSVWCAQGRPKKGSEDDLIPLTLAEVRRLLCAGWYYFDHRAKRRCCLSLDGEGVTRCGPNAATTEGEERSMTANCDCSTKGQPASIHEWPRRCVLGHSVAD